MLHMLASMLKAETLLLDNSTYVIVFINTCLLLPIHCAFYHHSHCGYHPPKKIFAIR